jgi:hypothetical protein
MGVTDDDEVLWCDSPSGVAHGLLTAQGVLSMVSAEVSWQLAGMSSWAGLVLS